jgi:hypothetical protein
MKRAVPLLIAFTLACPARAEFSFASPENNSAAPAADGADPSSNPAPTHHAHKRPKPHGSSVRPAPSKAQAIASGFGAQVPLAFAIRQMAPDGFEVVLEPPADPNVLVDWRGGRPWTQALADAVQPLGLEISLNDKTVTIRRPASH